MASCTLPGNVVKQGVAVFTKLCPSTVTSPSTASFTISPSSAYILAAQANQPLANNITIYPSTASNATFATTDNTKIGFTSGGTYQITVSMTDLPSGATFDVFKTGASVAGFTRQCTSDLIFRGMISLLSTDYITIVNNTSSAVTQAADKSCYVEIIKIN